MHYAHTEMYLWFIVTRNLFPLFFFLLPYVSELKSKLKKTVKKSKQLYSTDNRRHHVYHARLQLGCISLNFDLHGRNLVLSPCTSGSVETASHYLTKCPRYGATRRQYFEDIPSAMTMDNILGLLLRWTSRSSNMFRVTMLLQNVLMSNIWAASDRFFSVWRCRWQFSLVSFLKMNRL